MKKIIIISLTVLAVITAATIATIQIKPQMHKMVIPEQIIFVRGK